MTPAEHLDLVRRWQRRLGDYLSAKNLKLPACPLCGALRWLVVGTEQHQLEQADRTPSGEQTTRLLRLVCERCRLGTLALNVVHLSADP